jgi:transcriptional regulator with PAS, ATPase and Fis domain
MFGSIKTKLWDLLKEKEVSLAMLYNSEGEILWHKGREIVGKNIHVGKGFSKSFLQKAIDNRDTVEEEDVIIASKVGGLPQSASLLDVKSLIIQPVNDHFFLYIDSGTKDSFSTMDREVFKAMGELLGEMISQVKKNERDVGGITGVSFQIQTLRDNILKYSIEEEPVLILGETGVGKSHVAELIHRYSGRKGNFFTVNTPSIPDNLFESEIFGHKKGAFTDARTDKKGYVDEAKGGTLFFDEISEVPVSFQAKLLRFIETKKFMALGESVEKEADVRILAATNKNLLQAIKRHEFREDLYYRLQVLEMEIPPLRARKEDIKTLILEKRKYLKGKQIGKGFWDVVLNYDWPGNIRELITVLKRVGIHAENRVTGEDIHRIINQSSYKKNFNTQTDKLEKIWTDIKSGRSFWEVVRRPFLKRYLNAFEVRTIIERGLAESNGRYIHLIERFNIEKQDYKKFLNFLMVHKIMKDPQLA